MNKEMIVYVPISALEKPTNDGKWLNYHRLDFSHWLKPVPLSSLIQKEENCVTSDNNNESSSLAMGTCLGGNDVER